MDSNENGVALGDFARMEYEALRAEERDRMNARLQIWTIYLSLVGAFGLVSIQSGIVGYVTALCPLLLACLARYVRHSEDVLKQLRKFLLTLEKRSHYQGYEHYSREAARPSHGGYRKALRDTLLLTEWVAGVLVVVRLWFDHYPLVSVLVALIEAAALIFTSVWL